MNKVVWILSCCLICMLAVSCTKKESSEDTAAAKESAVAETAEAADIVGVWQITEWMADDVDQMEMWRVGDLTVEFREDGSIESKLAFSDGEGQTSGGTWKRDGNNLEIVVEGSNDTEGDEPFERTRDFVIDELSDNALVVHAEIGTAAMPIVLTYKAQRVATEGE